MVGQHAEEDVRLHAPLFLGKDRPLPQGRLEGPKRCFGPRQQSVDPPSLIRAPLASQLARISHRGLWEGRFPLAEVSSWGGLDPDGIKRCPHSAWKLG